jgi:hypothetical protein
MTEIDSMHQKITDLENLYKECVSNLNIANNKVVDEERKLLHCMQKLMPLQNTYLTGLIKLLQTQIEVINKKDKIVENVGVNTNQLVPNNIIQPKLLKHQQPKLKSIDEDKK